MNDLLHSVSEGLSQPTIPKCATPYGERIREVILSKSVIPATGNVPTAAEIYSAYQTGNVSLIKGVVRGHREKVSETVIEWHEKEYFDPVYHVTGRILRISEPIARMCEKLDRNPWLYMYYITSTNYCFGPYVATPSFSLVKQEGKGTPSAIDFIMEFVATGADYSSYSPYYDDVSQLSTVYFGDVDNLVDFGDGVIDFGQ